MVSNTESQQTPAISGGNNHLPPVSYRIIIRLVVLLYFQCGAGLFLLVLEMMEEIWRS